MKKILLCISFSFSCLAATFAQSYVLKLKGGDLTPSVSSQLQLAPLPEEVALGKTYAVMQWYQLPTDAEKRAIEKAGVQLLDYLPYNAYWVSIKNGTDLQAFQNKIRSVFRLAPQYKKDELILANSYPNWAKRGGNQVEVFVSYANDLKPHEVQELLAPFNIANGYVIDEMKAARLIIDRQQIDIIAAKPFVTFIELMDANPQPEETRTRSNHRSNFIDRRNTNGLQIRGNGIVVGLNDDGVIGPHIDYKGRLLANYAINTASGNDHGDHCGGIIMAAGNRDPRGEGMASGAQILVYQVGASASVYPSFDSAANHYNNKGLRIHSTSYGDGNNSGYTARARMLDLQQNNMPLMMHVFSAGNSGTSDFNWGAGAGWANITGGHKQGKNVTTVANLTYQDVLASSSSRGPARDGRIKPDISAVGTDVYSTKDQNNYVNMTGTSMACPAISGVYAQLMESYKLNNANVEGPAALLKGILLNTADDLGNAGPDFKFGYGRVNARRANQVITQHQHMTGSVSHGDSVQFNITVPATAKQLRVMTIWSDKEAVANAAVALVNNLDMRLIDPSSQSYLPWVLNSAKNATALNQTATRGLDSLNNMEQVTLDNPASGTYTVTVKGKTVAFGPQTFYVVYEFVEDAPILTYPIGKESFTPGQTEVIRWDALGNSGTFSLEYSVNNGTSWTTINGSVPGNARSYNWSVPNSAATITGQALIKLTRGSMSSTSPLPFSIMSVPASITASWVCADSMQVTCLPVNGATGYKLYVLGDKYMDSIGFSTTTTIIGHSPNITPGGWFSVQAVGANDASSARAYAQTFPAAPYNCSSVIVDLELMSIDFSGDSVYACGQSLVQSGLVATVKNNTTFPLNGVQIGITLNGAIQPLQTIPTSIAPGATYAYTVPSGVALQNGTNDISVYIAYGADVINTNDTLTAQKFVISGNSTVISSGTWMTDFNTMSVCDTLPNCGQTVCTLPNNFFNELNGVNDDIDWRVHSGPTPSRNETGATGPMAGNSGNYIYLEGNNCLSKEANLTSVCLALAAGGKYELRYDAHMYGDNIGNLSVDVRRGNTWDMNVQSVSGNKGDVWTTRSISLTPYAGSVINLRFRGTTLGELGDMAIDNISIIAQPSSIHETAQNSLNIYPNPAKDLLTIDAGNEWIKSIVITDATGRIVLQEQSNISLQKQNIGMAHLASGVYMIKVGTNKGVYNQKLMKQ